MLLAVAIIIGFGSAVVLASTGSLLMIVLIPIAASAAVLLAGFLLAYRRIAMETPKSVPASPADVPAASAASEGDNPQPA